MTTEAELGYGTLYQIFSGGDSPDDFVTMGEVTSVTPPNQEADRIEATHMQSPNRTREFIAGLIDPGEAEFSINFVPGSETYQRLRELQLSGETLLHRIVFPNQITMTYPASVLGISPEVPVDDRMTATIKIGVNGAVDDGTLT